MMVPLRNWWHLEAEPDADREGDDEDEVGKRDDYLRIILWNFDVMLILKRSDVVVFLQNPLTFAILLSSSPWVGWPPRTITVPSGERWPGIVAFPWNVTMWVSHQN